MGNHALSDFSEPGDQPTAAFTESRVHCRDLRKQYNGFVEIMQSPFAQTGDQCGSTVFSGLKEIGSASQQFSESATASERHVSDLIGEYSGSQDVPLRAEHVQFIDRGPCHGAARRVVFKAFFIFIITAVETILCYCLEDLSAEYYSPGFDRENVFLGVEADLEEDGSDACGKAGREKLQLHYVIGSSHLSPSLIDDVHDYIVSEYKRISNALKHNDNINIIGHPFGEGMRWAKAGKIAKWEWSLIPQHYLDDIIRLAGENGKALEINRCNISDPVYRDFLLRIRDEKVLWSVGSDAHTVEVTAAAAERTKMLENLDFSEENHWRTDK